MAVINLGIDLGSTALRVAYAAPGEQARVVATTDAEWPWLLCEPATADPLPVSFPSLKSKLGIATSVDVSGRRVAPVDVLGRALDALRARIVAAASAGVGQTVISVPARFSATQRTAVLDAATAAGLRDVSLITDSVAAVIGQTAGVGTGTFLVYAMGYHGFEIGLARAVDGRYRVLGYEGAGAPSGSTFDTQILRGWLAALRQRGMLPEEVRRGESGWRQLWETATRVKEGLVDGGPMVFPAFVRGPDGDQRLIARFDPPHFDQMVRSMVKDTLDRVDALLARAALGRQVIETVLLVGGSARMPQVRDLVAGLGAEVVPTADDHVARGAVLHAHQLEHRHWQTYEEVPTTTGSQQAEPVRHTSPLVATLLTAPDTAPDGGSAAVTTLDRARWLIESGRVDEARTDLRRLIAEARSMLDGIAAEPPTGRTDDVSSAVVSANELITTARKQFGRGEHDEAISVAHLAWRQEPDHAGVFSAMLDLHCDAAMADPTVANFPRDENWLRCALQHDPTNKRIRDLLAERMYLHGKELHRRGRPDDAREALRHALIWDPRHHAADELLRRFDRRR